MLHIERQHLAAWVQVLVIAALVSGAVTTALMPSEAGRWWIIVPLIIGAAVYLVFTPMTVEVHSDAMHVRFGYLNWPGWFFPIDDIADARVVTFRPLRDYGGWGIRRGDEGYCLNERGDSGVRFEYLARTYTVGSDEPGRLLAALRTAGADVEEA